MKTEQEIAEIEGWCAVWAQGLVFQYEAPYLLGEYRWAYGSPDLPEDFV